MAELSPELKKIKKIYGENFMKLCRGLFPTLLEREGVLLNILTKTFADNSKSLYEDIIANEWAGEFKSLVYSKVEFEDSKEKGMSKKTPYDLLSEAGYDLYECRSEEEIQSFKKYYAPGEELCTFDGGRLDKAVVFFAVRKDVDKIKREDFDNPQREDEYGTSVMGIQFDKIGTCTVSIKNRYNHTVENPDATYGNDLERIHEGLTQSFNTLLGERGMELYEVSKKISGLPGYVVGDDGKYYKYNIEKDGVFYCPGNVVIKNRNVKKILDPEKQILVDNYIIDTQKKEIYLYEPGQDAFVDSFIAIEKIEVKKDKENGNGIRIVTIQQKGKEQPVIITIDKDNQIIGYKNESLMFIGDNFMAENKALRSLEMPNVIRIGNNFLRKNQGLTEMSMNQLEQVGDDFLSSNTDMARIEIPNIKSIGKSALRLNQNLIELDVPNLEVLGENFMYYNENLKRLNVPRLRRIGNNFLPSNKAMEELNVPSLETVGANFMSSNEILKSIKAPQLREIQKYFLPNNIDMTDMYMPNVQQIGDYFLRSNTAMTELSLPNVEQIGNYFLRSNKEIAEVNLPNLKSVGSRFMDYNEKLMNFKAENLENVGDGFLENNIDLQSFKAPNLRIAGDQFMYANKSLDELDVPSLERVGEECLYSNYSLKEGKFPNLQRVGSFFLGSNVDLEKLDVPSLIYCNPGFLYSNENVERLYLPNLETAEDSFLENNKKITELYAPKLTRYGKKFLAASVRKAKIKPQNIDEIRELFTPEKTLLEEDNEKSKETVLSLNQENLTPKEIQPEPITVKDIASLDRKHELTTSEVSVAARMIERLKRYFSRNNDTHER